MASRSSRKRQRRRDRRKAKASGWARKPKGQKVGHGTSIADVLVPKKTKHKVREIKPDTVVRESGPEPESEFRAAFRDLSELA